MGRGGVAMRMALELLLLFIYFFGKIPNSCMSESGMDAIEAQICKWDE